MTRQPSLTGKLRARARSSMAGEALLSAQGRILTSLMQSSGESDEAYLSRILRLERDEKRAAGRFLLEHKPQTVETVKQMKTFLTERLDRLVDSFVSSGERFLIAAQNADPEWLAELAAQGAPVNYHDPRNGLTALHYVAAQGARRAFRVLLRIPGLDFLARDDQGRLASEMAGAYGHNRAMERLLFRKEIQQARARGISLEQLYQRDGARPPAPSNP